MSSFKSLLAAYLAAHPDVLPPADDNQLSFERNGLGWNVSVKNGGERFTTTLDSEELMGWVWLNVSGQAHR